MRSLVAPTMNYFPANKTEEKNYEELLNLWYVDTYHSRYNPDEDGWVWLCNIEKGAPSPFRYAYNKGFLLPEFDIREPLIPPSSIDNKEFVDILLEECEGVYVREKYIKGDPVSTNTMWFFDHD